MLLTSTLDVDLSKLSVERNVAIRGSVVGSLWMRRVPQRGVVVVRWWPGAVW